jgi:alkylation response protein AidB-like acyl-CoA dehydrogenase
MAVSPSSDAVAIVTPYCQFVGRGTVDLELSDDEAALRDNVRTVLAGICPPAVVRAVHDGEEAPPSLWADMVELGWPALAIDERHGGLGLGFVELALVAEELGRSVVPSPLLATTTQFAPVVRELADEDRAARFLPAVTSGTSTGTLALAEDGRWDPVAVQTTARRDGGDWILDGQKATVVDGATADEIVVVARGEGGLGAFVVASGDVEATPRTTLDPTLPVADLRLDGVTVPEERVLAEPGTPGVERGVRRATEEAAVAMAAMTVGACRKIFETTVDYAKVREQFDRPIGSFQAIKHRLVDMYLAVERASALVHYAALTIAEDTSDRGQVAVAAKAAAGDCQRLVVEDGLQLHGGIGYTWEQDLHFLLKRAKTGDALFGSAVAQRAELAQLLGVR